MSQSRAHLARNVKPPTRHGDFIPFDSSSSEDCEKSRKLSQQMSDIPSREVMEKITMLKNQYKERSQSDGVIWGERSADKSREVHHETSKNNTQILVSDASLTFTDSHNNNEKISQSQPSLVNPNLGDSTDEDSAVQLSPQQNNDIVQQQMLENLAGVTEIQKSVPKPSQLEEALHTDRSSSESPEAEDLQHQRDRSSLKPKVDNVHATPLSPTQSGGQNHTAINVDSLLLSTSASQTMSTANVGNHHRNQSSSISQAPIDSPNGIGIQRTTADENDSSDQSRHPQPKNPPVSANDHESGAYPQETNLQPQNGEHLTAMTVRPETTSIPQTSHHPQPNTAPTLEIPVQQNEEHLPRQPGATVPQKDLLQQHQGPLYHNQPPQRINFELHDNPLQQLPGGIMNGPRFHQPAIAVHPSVNFQQQGYPPGIVNGVGYQQLLGAQWNIQQQYHQAQLPQRGIALGHQQLPGEHDREQPEVFQNNNDPMMPPGRLNHAAPLPPMNYFDFQAAQVRQQQNQERPQNMNIDIDNEENIRPAGDNSIDTLRVDMNRQFRRIERSLNRLRPQNDAGHPPAFLKFDSIASIEAFENASEDDYQDLVQYMIYNGSSTLKTSASRIIKATLSDALIPTVTIKRRAQMKSTLRNTRFLRACYSALRRMGKFGPQTDEQLSSAMTAGLKTAKVLRNYHNRRAANP